MYQGNKDSMDRDILFRFFEGHSNVEEELAIQQWMEASDDNRDTFMRERMHYDAMLMVNVSDDNVEPIIRTIPLRKRMRAMAAAVAVLLLSGLVYLWTTRDIYVGYTTLHVPAGQRVNLILADSTEVWLNANTTFSYPISFGSEEREVRLDGEAYFEVFNDKAKPFIVKTEQGDVRVTGTKFNVSAYVGLKNFETSLFEGGVDLYKEEKKLLSLRPNQKAILKDNVMQLLAIDGDEAYLWRNGLIGFKNKKLADIFPVFEKSFNVKINVLNQSLTQTTYTGKFRQSEGVDYALRILQRSLDFTYYRDDETGTIYIK